MEYYQRLTDLISLTFADSCDNEADSKYNSDNNQNSHSLETFSVILDLLFLFDIDKKTKPYHKCWSVGSNKNGQQANKYNIHDNKRLRIMNKLPNNMYINDIVLGCWGSTYVLYNNYHSDSAEKDENADKLIVFGCNESGQLSVDAQVIEIIIKYWTKHNKIIITEDIITIITKQIKSSGSKWRSILTPMNVNQFAALNHKISFISSGIPSHHKFIVTQDKLSGKDHLFGVGRNNHNQLGASDRRNRNEFTEIKYFRNISAELAQIHCARDYTHFLTEKGELFEASERSIAIKPIKMKATIIDLCCGYEHTLAINHNRGIYSWGDNFYGQLGHGRHKSRVAEPKMIRALNRSVVYADEISAGQHHSAIVSTSGQVHVFGWNEFYQCGDCTDENIFVPKLNEELHNIDVKQVKCGFNHNVAITHDGEYYFWGHNRYNQCMVYNHSEKYVKKPTKWQYTNDIGQFRKIIAIYPGWCSTIVVTT